MATHYNIENINIMLLLQTVTSQYSSNHVTNSVILLCKCIKERSISCFQRTQHGAWAPGRYKNPNRDYERTHSLGQLYVGCISAGPSARHLQMSC